MERILVTLTSSESKRLIGKGVANHPEVKKAFKEGIVFIATSTSTAFVAEELLNMRIEGKGLFTAGVVVPRGICITDGEMRHRYIGIKKGKASDVTLAELRDEWLPEMGSGDVFIKGANAIDSTGTASILLGNPRGKGTGGTIGTVIGTISTRGIRLIITAGLEKLVPGLLADIPPIVGPFKYAAGFPSGMILVRGLLMTEIEVFKLLTKTKAIPIAAGGINGAEGCQTFIVEGTSDSVENAWMLIKEVKGEQALTTVTRNCDECNLGCSWNIDPELIKLRRSFETL